MDEHERLLRQVYARQMREHAAEDARRERENLYRRLLVAPAYEMEDPVRRWRREADEQDARFAAERAQWEREQDEERRRRYAMQSDDTLGLQIETFNGIADALEGIDSRLARVERRHKSAKAARTSRPIALPNFLGPKHAPHDPSLRYSQPTLTRT
jgi:hypothetical protein